MSKSTAETGSPFVPGGVFVSFFTIPEYCTGRYSEPFGYDMQPGL
jgi:hypothetical protein